MSWFFNISQSWSLNLFKVSYWTYGCLNILMALVNIFGTSLMDFSYQCSNCPVWVSGSLFKFGLWVLQSYSAAPLFSGMTRCSRLILCISCPNPGIKHFSKELAFLHGKQYYLETTTWVWGVLIATRLVIVSFPSFFPPSFPSFLPSLLPFSLPLAPFFLFFLYKEKLNSEFLPIINYLFSLSL